MDASRECLAGPPSLNADESTSIDEPEATTRSLGLCRGD
jgi:hypothetical protein